LRILALLNIMGVFENEKLRWLAGTSELAF
jgi:hypothetical protein